MNKRNLTRIALLAFIIIMNGCMVISFYPLYEASDLFDNDIITGAWSFENEKETWLFTHPYKDGEGSDTIRKNAYQLNFIDSTSTLSNMRFLVHLIEIDDQYYLDFTVENLPFGKDEGSETLRMGEGFIPDGSNVRVQMSDVKISNDSSTFKDLLHTMHYLPVHSFAKLNVYTDSIEIQWIDPEWLETMIKEHRMHMKYERSGDQILLTESPQKLKLFIQKYGNEDIYDQEIILHAQKDE